MRRLKDDVDQALLMNATEPERFAATGGLPAAHRVFERDGWRWTVPGANYIIRCWHCYDRSTGLISSPALGS